MTRSLRTRAELEAEILAARHELLEAEDCGLFDIALLARERCDTLLDLLWHLIPEQRSGT